MSNDSYQRENPLGQTIILFVIFLALFLGGIFCVLVLEPAQRAARPAGHWAGASCPWSSR